MDTGQAFLYGILLLWLVFQVRRWMQSRTIPRYGPEDVAERVRTGGSVLVDVRTSQERSVRNIPGSLHLPASQIGSRWSELDTYRDREVIFYCATGSRSMAAAIRAKKAGFTVAHLEGGIATWRH